MDFGMFANVGLVGGIIAILQVIKTADTKHKLAKGFYIIAALVLGFLSGFVVTPYSEPIVQWVQAVIMNGVVYAGAASILYQTGKLGLSTDTEKFVHK